MTHKTERRRDRVVTRTTGRPTLLDRFVEIAPPEKDSSPLPGDGELAWVGLLIVIVSFALTVVGIVHLANAAWGAATGLPAW